MGRLGRRRAKPAGSSIRAPDWVLRDVTFTIEPGETVAIVGHTGAGKTTLISLLLRFYDVQKGAVRIDGIDVRDMDLADLRSRFGVVLQDPFLFSGTIGGNIRLGTKRIQDNDIEKAAEDVNLADFIRACPKGSTKKFASEAPRFPPARNNSSRSRAPWPTNRRF